jgi:DNA-binding NarL/FixJ family response regulator
MADLGMRKSTRENADEPPRLRPREREILQLLTRGRSNKEIGAALGIHEQTVKNAVSVLCEKLHARNRVQLVVVALLRLRKPENASHDE